MSKLFVYLVILVLYLLGMLFIGFWANRKAKSDDDYFLARNKLGPATIGFSFSATQMSGSTFMGAVGTTSVLGYNFMPAALASAAAPWFAYILAGDRMRKIASRLKSVTLSDIFEARYNSKYAGVIPTILMLIAFIPLIAGQLQAAASAFSVMFGFPYIVGLLIFAVIIIIYTVLGGMFAVAWTDLIQGFLMIGGFLILSVLALHSTGGFSEMNLKYAEINPKGITLTGVMSPIWVVSGLFVWGFFQIGGSPASVTRFLIPENDKTLKKALGYSIIFQSFMYLCFSIIAIGGAVMLPKLQNHDLLVPTLVFNFLPPVLGGIVLAGALGAMMSTVSSVLLLSGSLVSVNIINKFKNNKISDSKSLLLSRITTIVIGVVALLFAIHPPAAILWIITMSFSLLAASFTFPLLLGLWWPRATKEGGIAGIVVGAVASIVWYILGYIKFHSLDNWIWGIWPAIFGGVLSLIVVVVVSLLTKPIPKEIAEIFFDDIDVKTTHNLPPEQARG